MEQYRAEIAKQMVKPFQEKALQYVTQCLDKSQEFNLLSGWTPKCYSLAGELDEKRFPVVRTFYLPPVQNAVLLPQGTTKIAKGNVKTFAYPWYSTGLFGQGEASRQVASAAAVPP